MVTVGPSSRAKFLTVKVSKSNKLLND